MIQFILILNLIIIVINKNNIFFESMIYCNRTPFLCVGVSLNKNGKVYY